MLTFNAFNIGTLSNSVSYIFRFLKADFNRMRRNVWRSIAQSRPSVTACMEAALKWIENRYLNGCLLVFEVVETSFICAYNY